SNRSPSLRLRF
uniref:Short neuropeptide F n=3 Tax=Polyneoptera TaxID=33341 RepID=SNPF_SCHGR|nr:RecName: Full=Short neuropeptide F; Short=Lom-sNPF; Short=sNPF; Contains: RecName: Full=Short neuropeptide F4-11; Short=Lom-sNPF4-11 [Locusta migratoria]P86445.1 RecName: Full=Short neuropeptide F; Short=Scg-sNPF; Short=sNPF; Contains: RecName: Full=Short neuropeptide F4-11; Short=Scg-sNPF4-11 [Schistocerca gregaria]